MSSELRRRVRWRAPVIQATGRLRLADRLSSGALSCSGLCRSGVRTKFGIDMVLLGEPGTTRSSKEGCTGPGKVCDWKNYFTVAQSEEFDEDYNKKMESSTLRFYTEFRCGVCVCDRYSITSSQRDDAWFGAASMMWKGIDSERLTRPEMFDFHGVNMIHYYTDNWENIQRFQAKPDDILIASYPKSGNTWMSYILDLLCFGISPQSQKSLPLPMKVPTLEITIPVKESFQNVQGAVGSGPTFTGVEHANMLSTSPRLIKTHLPVQFIPKTFWEQNCKIVYVARNPKDNLVSYFHFDQMHLMHPVPKDWSSYFHRFLLGQMVYGSWYDHVNDWWIKKETYCNLHYVFYEDMVKGTRLEIDKLFSFLNFPHSSEEKDRITAKVQFNEMKENPFVNHSGFSGFDWTKSTFMRKGKVGDWKNCFTVAQNEEFDEDYNKKMENSTLRFYTAS